MAGRGLQLRVQLQASGREDRRADRAVDRDARICERSTPNLPGLYYRILCAQRYFFLIYAIRLLCVSHVLRSGGGPWRGPPRWQPHTLLYTLRNGTSNFLSSTPFNRCTHSQRSTARPGLTWRRNCEYPAPVSASARGLEILGLHTAVYDQSKNNVRVN